jgi:hypothetical protein
VRWALIMKKWPKRVGLGFLAIVLILSAVTYVRFSQWPSEVTKNLERDSTVVHTAKGPIEYAEIGQAPTVGRASAGTRDATALCLRT